MSMETNFLELQEGQSVLCLDDEGVSHSGEIMAVDLSYKIFILKSPASNNISKHCNVKMFNFKHLKDLKIIKKTQKTAPLLSINYDKLTSRVKNNVEAKLKMTSLVGVNVSPLGQELLLSLTKTVPDVHWNGDTIVVMNEFFIKPPYSPSDCHNNNNKPVKFVRDLVTKFHDDNLKTRQNTTSVT